MYHFLTSDNTLALPNTSISKIDSHSFDTAAFLQQLKANYPRYRPFVKDRAHFEAQIHTLGWFADRTYRETEAEFFFNVRLYESVFHSEFDHYRNSQWSGIIRPYLSEGSLNEQALENMHDYVQSRVFRLPPALMRIEYHYHFLAAMENRYFKEVVASVLHKRLESTGLTDTLLAQDVLKIYQTNIPVAKLLTLLDAAAGHAKADYVYLLCQKLFFETVRNKWEGFDGPSFGKIWNDVEDPRVQMLKGGFIDLVTGLLKSSDATRAKLEAFIKGSVKLFEGILEQDKREAYLYMIEALRSGFPFGTLGDATKEQLSKVDLSERFIHAPNNITPFVW